MPSSFIPLIAVCIVAAFILIPIRTILNKCYNWERNVRTLKKYTEHFLEFSSDYDRENPVTK